MVGLTITAPTIVTVAAAHQMRRPPGAASAFAAIHRVAMRKAAFGSCSFSNWPQIGVEMETEKKSATATPRPAGARAARRQNRDKTSAAARHQHTGSGTAGQATGPQQP